MNKEKLLESKKVRIITVQLAVRDDLQIGEYEDEISALLSENGIWNNDSSIIDWTYISNIEPVFTNEELKNMEEGEIFNNIFVDVQFYGEDYE